MKEDLLQEGKNILFASTYIHGHFSAWKFYRLGAVKGLTFPAVKICPFGFQTQRGDKKINESVWIFAESKSLLRKFSKGMVCMRIDLGVGGVCVIAKLSVRKYGRALCKVFWVFLCKYMTFRVRNVLVFVHI